MKYLVSVPREMEEDKRWTTRREPVVPCFPSQHTGAFLTVPSFLLAEKAEVAETDADADEMAAALAREYPGLPRVLHENYVFAVWKAALNAPIGTTYRVTVNQKQALLLNTETGESVSLWEEQPLA